MPHDITVPTRDKFEPEPLIGLPRPAPAPAPLVSPAGGPAGGGFRQFLANPAVADFGFALLANNKGKSFLSSVGQAGLLANRSAQQRKRNAIVDELGRERIENVREQRSARKLAATRATTKREAVAKFAHRLTDPTSDLFTDGTFDKQKARRGVLQIPDLTAPELVAFTKLFPVATATAKPSQFKIHIDDRGDVWKFDKLSNTVLKNGQPTNELPTQFQLVQGVQDGLQVSEIVNLATGEKFGVSKKGAEKSPEQAAKIALLTSGLGDLAESRKIILDESDPKNIKVNSSSILAMQTRFPGTEGRRAAALFLNAIEAKLRAESGAAVPDTEVTRIAIRFFPSVLNNDEQNIENFNRLDEFLNTSLELSDPRLFRKLQELAKTKPAGIAAEAPGTKTARTESLLKSLDSQQSLIEELRKSRSSG